MSNPSEEHRDECEVFSPGVGNTRQRITDMGMSQIRDHQVSDSVARHRANNQLWVWGHRLLLSQEARGKIKSIVADAFGGPYTTLTGLWSGVRERFEETFEVDVPAPDAEQCRLFYDALATDQRGQQAGEEWITVQELEGRGAGTNIPSGLCQMGHQHAVKGIMMIYHAQG
jgi:hypothetical protein